MKYVVFDGDCGICSASAEFINKNKINNDIETIPSFLFQLDKYEIDLKIAELTVIFIDTETGKKYFRVRAVCEILKYLGLPLRILGFVFANDIVAFILNPIYNTIAKNRAYISTKFGFDACKIR